MRAALLPSPEAPAAPGIPRAWVDAYLRRVARVRGRDASREAARQLTLFFQYAEGTGCSDAARLAWWEYSLALEWIGAQSVHRAGLARARRFLDSVRSFHRFLVATGQLADCYEVDRARAALCGGGRLRLIRRPPYTGAETWMALRGLRGSLVTFSVADFWLSLLWRHCGGSWAALERRVRDAPRGEERLALMQGLRHRLEEARCPHPLRLLSAETAVADVEDALHWLSEPMTEPRLPPFPEDADLAGLDATALVARFPTDSPRMPRREMQELLRRRDAAVPALMALLAGERALAGRDPLWAIVVLGELRRPQAIEALAAFLGCEEGGLGTAAAEALGKIGPAAVPRLRAACARTELTVQLHAYGALGMIRTEEAYQILVSALERRPDAADVVARALAQQGRREAIAPLTRVRARTHGWMRPQVDSAIRSLAEGAQAPEPVERDWRLRYRRLPRLEWSFLPSWLTVATVARSRHREHSQRREAARAFAAPPESSVCPTCGGIIWRPTGLSLCRHTAAGVIGLQRAEVARWLDAGMRDAWQVLDACDAEDEDVARRPRGRASAATRDAIALRRATLYALVGLGREDLRAGARYLGVIAEDFAALHDATGPLARRPIGLQSRHPQNFSQSQP